MKADNSIWPSMPMLTTPARSPISPHSAPNTSGVEWRTVAGQHSRGLMWVRRYKEMMSNENQPPRTIKVVR